jgi:hypothetical protein
MLPYFLFLQKKEEVEEDDDRRVLRFCFFFAFPFPSHNRETYVTRPLETPQRKKNNQNTLYFLMEEALRLRSSSFLAFSSWTRVARSLA